MALLDGNGRYYKIENVGTIQNLCYIAEYENIEHRQDGETEFRKPIRYTENIDIATKMNDTITEIPKDVSTLYKRIVKLSYELLKDKPLYSGMEDC